MHVCMRDCYRICNFPFHNVENDHIHTVRIYVYMYWYIHTYVHNMLYVCMYVGKFSGN